MNYRESFEFYLLRKDTHKVAILWDELLRKDHLEAKEIVEVLQLFKQSEMVPRLGTLIEKGGNVLNRFSDPKENYEVLRCIIDLQNSNSPQLANLAIEALTARYGNDPKFQEKLRLVGLRDLQDFKGAISNFELLNHLMPGNFVFHVGGWGAGEILEASWLREEVILEFENVTGKKAFSFKSAFKNLLALPTKHFLSQRFGTPDELEQIAKEDPVQVIKLLLKDLGPKNAMEIKDELLDLVIPEQDWAKWWQNTRIKLKKDPEIMLPKTQSDPFVLLEHSMTSNERLNHELTSAKTPQELIEVCHNFIRDFPNYLKEDTVKSTIIHKLEQIELGKLNSGQQFERLCLLEDMGQMGDFTDLLNQAKSVKDFLEEISILALKKRFLTLFKEKKVNWQQDFIELMNSHVPNPLRDWIFQLLLEANAFDLLQESLQQILQEPKHYPHTFVWYFQKIMDDASFPFKADFSKQQFFEALLSLLCAIELDPQYKELVKRIYGIILEKRYLLVRKIFEVSSKEQLKEYLLLALKSHIFTNQDKKIFHSLAEVKYPELATSKPEEAVDVIWTTKEGYERVQKRIRYIGEHEMIENAKEIAEARAHGDLRENAEYKYAQEKRARLQTELKLLSRQIQKARILTPDDVMKEEISIGSIVQLEDQQGNILEYTLLGPWDANPENNILSFQSRFAEAMLGKKVGDSVSFKDETYKIKRIATYFEY